MLLVEINRNLGVAFALELVTLGLQILANRVMAVEFSVDDHVYLALRIVERLLSFGGEIDNSETVVAEGCGRTCQSCELNKLDLWSAEYVTHQPVHSR